MTDFATAAAAIVEVGGRLDQRGLAPATAGNYSIRLDDGSIAITVSGAHKARLTTAQVMRVAADGTPLDGKRPSAETLLHCLIYATDAHAGAVLHTHSVPGTVLSRALGVADRIVLSDYELLKIFPGIGTHDTKVALPLVGNSQDMTAMAEEVRPRLMGGPPAFYIGGHGLYAWGDTIDAAEAIVEGTEFLLACAWEEHKLQGATR